MALYLVVAVRFDRHGEVERVQWRCADGARNIFTTPAEEVEVDRVVEAFDRGDVVELWFDTPLGKVSGPRLRRKVLAGGRENIVEHDIVEGRTLHDLPTF
jgi:hypothetical protein